MVSFRGLQFIQSSSFPPSQPTRKVNLPTRCRANRIFSDISRVSGKAAANCTELIRGTLTLSRYRHTQIGGWQKLSTSLRHGRPCLPYTGKCRGKVQILLQCALDHGHKHGIVETSPPRVELWRRPLRLHR